MQVVFDALDRGNEDGISNPVGENHPNRTSLFGLADGGRRVLPEIVTPETQKIVWERKKPKR